jgi:hypothetical protein
MKQVAESTHVASLSTIVATSLLHLLSLLSEVLLLQLGMKNPAGLLPMALLITEVAIQRLLFFQIYLRAKLLNVTPLAARNTEIYLSLIR